MSEIPPFLPAVKAHWYAKLDALRASNELAEKDVKRLRDADSANPSDRLQQAQLQQLSAAQAYNSFVESGSQYIKMALDAESRLQRRDLSLLEIVQLKTTRDTMYALSAEFISFKAENQMVPMHLRPVDAGGQTHYIDGRVEWNGSLSGLAGQAWEGLQDIAAGVKEALVRGPFTAEENYAICQSALGGLLPQLAGKTIPAPGSKPGEILWGEAVGKALDAADPAGQMCRVVYPPGTSPQDVWRLGQTIQGFDPVAGSAFTAVLFMPPEMAEARVVDAFVGTGMDDAWNELVEAFGAFPGMDGLPRFDAADAWSASGQAQHTQGAGEWGDEAADGAEELAARDDGQDTIGQYDALQSDREVMAFLSFEMDQQWRQGDGAQLALNLIGTPERSVLGEGFADPLRSGDTAVFSDGQRLVEQQLHLLVQAMAQFSPPPPGATSWSDAAYASSRSPVLAAPR